MKNKILQEILNESLAKNQDKIAIQWGNQGLSYHELETRTRHIANDLIKRGIKPQTFIGILMEDKMQFIQVMLGILKAGCVFVPLDPDLPSHRLEIMIKIADIRLIISDHNRNRWWIDRNTRHLDCQWIRMDEIFSLQEASWYDDNPEIRCTPGDKIYIYFTSGSTGTPRAMVGKNKSLLHFIHWQINTFGIDETFRCSQLINPMFDAILRDIFVPLCLGGTVCIPDNSDITRDAEKFSDWLEKTKIHLIHCAPALFKVLNSNHLKQDRLKHLKFILLSGERIHPSDIVNWYDTFDERVQLVNLWGTSETTMAKTYYFIRKSDTQRERIPIGKPMKGAMVVVLDKTMKVCSEQVIGDLYIRTPFRTLGYLNEPELTHERFIQNPFSTDPSDLLHMTGDLGVLLTDGNLDIIGRMDRQVKIRGIRIELEGIESVLVKHPSVDEAVVIKKVTPTNEELLCAYITIKEAAPGQEPQDAQKEILPAELQDYLKTVLPEYMVPGIILTIDHIPRNPNGKIVYDRLPDPLNQREEDYIPPRNALEEKIMELWQGILGIKKLSVTSHFFNLGGNSLNVMTLISKIHKEFDVRIPLGKIFNCPTIEEQAEIIQGSKTDKYQSIKPVEKREYYSLSSAQKRLYVLYRMDKEGIPYNIPFAVELEGDLQKEVMARSFKRLIIRHESFRTSFKMVKEVPVQKLDDDVEFEIEYYDLATEDAEEPTIRNPQLAPVLISSFIRPFDLSRAPLLRVGIIKIGQSRYVLEVDMHHIISDGTSAGILIKDFMALYSGEDLQGLRIQYKDFSEWQNQLIASGEMAKQEKYWLKEFEGEIPVVNLPLDYPRPVKPDFEGNKIFFELDHQLTEAINGLASETGTTLHILLLAVYIVLLSKYSGQEDIVVGFGIAGRTHADLENVVGMFVNMIAMRSRPLGSLSFFEFIMEVKEKSINAYENQDYQFEELVRKLGIQRDFGRNPLFEAVFSFYNLPTASTRLPGMKLQSYSIDHKNSQFDLALAASLFKGKIAMILDYLTALFKPSTVQQIAKQYVEVVEQVVENKHITLKDISISHDMAVSTLTFSKEEMYDFNL